MSKQEFVWLKPKEKMYIEGREVVQIKCIATEMDKLKSKGRLQGKQPDLRRPVYCLNNQITYESITDAANKIGLSPSAISKVCNKKQTTTRGFIFRFAS